MSNGHWKKAPELEATPEISFEKALDAPRVLNENGSRAWACKGNAYQSLCNWATGGVRDLPPVQRMA